MKIRVLAGCKGLLWAVAVASLILLPSLASFAAATPLTGPTATATDTTDYGKLVKAPTLYPRSNYIWPFGAGPYYGDVDASQWDRAGVLHTAVGSFDMTRGLPAFPGELRTNVRFGQIGSQYFVLQVDPAAFGSGSWDQIKGVVESNGGAFVQEMTVAAFIVRLNSAAYSQLQSASGILALEPWHPAFKLSPTIGRAPLPDPMKATSEVYTLDARVFAGEDASAVAKSIAALGGNVLGVLGETVRFELNRNRISQVAALEPVYMIFEAVPVFVQGEESATTVMTGRWNHGDLPYTLAGIRGDGNGIAGAPQQYLSIVDSGIQLDAGELSDTRALPGTAGVAHRKVRNYTTTNAFGGSGDLLGCDASGSGGFTHGHTVSSTALGNATDVPGSYGAGWIKTDTGGNPWKFDGIAPRAKVVAYDAQVTPATLGCDDPGQGGIIAGDLYTAPSSGSMHDAYTNFGARIFNYSWGATNSAVYDTNPTDIDTFLAERQDAMAFISAGNASADTNSDGIPDSLTVSTPATAKDAIVVGASGTANDTAGVSANAPNARAGFSSVGPATSTSNRVAPILMAPGVDGGTLGLAAEYNCRSNDNDQTGTVECDTAQGLSGTSFSSPAAAGAALVVRDYFAQGFYPDGTASNPGNAADQVTNISGALMKSILIASTRWMGGKTAAGVDLNTPGGGLTKRFRFNNEQGYGAIQLTNVLPLTTYASAKGLIVADGGIAGGVNNTTLSGNVAANGTDSYQLNVCDNTQDLRVALAWMDPAGDTLARNLDLEMVSPAGRTYWGNYFTDDNNKDGTLNTTTENCNYSGVPYPPTSTGVTDSGPYSLPVCANSARDTQNPTEAIFLGADTNHDGLVLNTDNQVEVGTNWTVRVINRNGVSAQRYAVAIAGPVCLGSSVSLNVLDPDGSPGSGSFACNSKATITINEVADPNDASINNNAAEVASRTTLRVIDVGPDGLYGTGDDIVKDTETLPAGAFTDTDGAGAGLKYTTSAITLSDGTAPDPGNGVLDIADGNRIEVTYQDKTLGSPDANKKRVNALPVDCRTTVVSGGIVFAQFGRDTLDFVSGGCERDARGFFTMGFPDHYMDAGELIGYSVVFRSAEDIDLTDVQVSLRAVQTDVDSPVDCKPNTTACADPNRLNNPPSTDLTILNPNRTIGNVTAGGILTTSFSIQMNASIAGTPTIELVTAVSARKSGKPVASYVVARHILNVDEVSFYYSTDFPTGGTVTRDYNNNESIENPITDPDGFVYYQQKDYRFEQRTFANMQATGRNTGLNSPWNFDTNNGGFTSGRTNNSTGTLATQAQWGEDRNFNNVLDAGEDRDPVNGVLDQNWNTRGGCGWQTRSGATGGVWHTGRIDLTTLTNCTASAQTAARCQSYELVPGYFLNNVWWELLVTPTMQKVHQCATGTELDCTRNGSPVADVTDDPVFQVQLVNWAWNVAMDIKTSLTGMTLEFDGDTTKIDPVDLYNDFAIFNSVFGDQGAISGGNAPITDGFNLFAPISKCLDTDNNGTPDHCGFKGGIACTDDTPCSGNTVNGTVGNNRQGQNNCFFEGKTAGVVKAKSPFGLALPPDDDLRNGWCPNLSGALANDKSKVCVTNADCAGLPGYSTTCTFDGATTVDQFVQNNGPIRNFSMETANGIDLYFDLLEDLYGDSGTSFNAALGFYTQEGSPSAQPATSYGIAVDDMVVEWREFKLDTDTTDCATNGQCADVEVSSIRLFDGNTLLPVTITDSTPYDAVNNKNDCNNNGSYADTGLCKNAAGGGSNTVCSSDGTCGVGEHCVGADDQDCNDNGIQDVTALVTSDSETTGELLVLDKDGSTNLFKGNMPVSSTYDSVGVLFIARNGTQNPTVTVKYTDRNDGTGNVCRSDPDPARAGVLTAQSIIALDAARVALAGIRITDDGDHDGWPDQLETVDVFVTLKNKSGATLHNVKAALQTNDSKIACISRPQVFVGDIPNLASVETPTSFRFVVGNNFTRTTVDQVVQTTFTVTLKADEAEVTSRALTFNVDLDLDATGGGTPTTFNESFEVASGFNQFTSMTLDTGKASTALSNGFRCQYNDPDGLNSNDPGRVSCFLGFTSSANNGYDWHVHSGGAADNNVQRAYTGTRSLHWGVYPSTGAKRDTERFSQLDAIRVTNPINIAFGEGASPELNFAHQISLGDNRSTNTPAGEAADRAVVHVQLADNSGNPVGNWIKLYPFENEYDAQGTDNFSNCTFDPTDDGNNEDSFFDTTDPFRRLGPSSTCFPEFTFVWHGDTDFRNTAVTSDNSKLGRAVDGPPLQGSVNIGTWVRPRFSLFNYKGRRIRPRLVATSIELTGAVTYNDAGGLGSDNKTGDDGWYVDDFNVTGASTAAATLAVDDHGATTGGGVCPTCTTVTAALSASPSSTTAAPGQPVTLDASASTANACNTGLLQYQFWDDANGDGVVGNAGDTLLRDWTDNPLYQDAPLLTTRYSVKVRCSTAPTCGQGSAIDSHTLVTVVNVTCPQTWIDGAFDGDTSTPPVAGVGTGTDMIFVNRPIGTAATNKGTINWTTVQTVDVIRGGLNDLLAASTRGNHNVGPLPIGRFAGVPVQACDRNDGAVNAIDLNVDGAPEPALAAGQGYFYLVRSAVPAFAIGTLPACNYHGWGDGWIFTSSNEVPGRDFWPANTTIINADANTCALP